MSGSGDPAAPRYPGTLRADQRHRGLWPFLPWIFILLHLNIGKYR